MRHNRDEWVKLVGEWQRSRQTARQFALAHGVTDTALRYWAGRLAKEVGGAKEEASPMRQPTAPTGVPTLARVVRSGEAPPVPSGPIAIVIGNATLLVEPGFEPEHLRALLRTLSEAG
jgi:transposase-like protein